MLPGNAERKCIPELMEAISIVGRLHPSVRFVLAGECHWKYQQMARELGVAGRIHFAGVVSKSQKIAFLGACMLYAQPSRFEGFGLGILEAMSCGAPIVTSRVGGVPEVVGGCGIYVDGCSAQSIGEGICRMIGDETLRTECGQAGRQRAVQMFSFSRRKLELAKCIGELGS
jgi:glycosyltransferase involved in cell wall biosynthesis